MKITIEIDMVKEPELAEIYLAAPKMYEFMKSHIKLLRGDINPDIHPYNIIDGVNDELYDLKLDALFRRTFHED